MEPLHGVRIIEVTTNAAGPMATGMLADQGADVIRIEPVGAGDPSRHVGGNRGGVSAYNAYMNRNKRSMALDLKNPELREPMLALIRGADVFVQNSRPGALDRYGYGYDDLHAECPELIYVSISGFGPGGPASHERVYDPVIQCVTGFADLQGGGGAPELVRTIVSDKVAALTAAQAIAAALYARERGSAGGQHVELSMLDASLAFLWPECFWNDSFAGDESYIERPLISDFYRLLEAADGHVSLVVVGDEEFRACCEELAIEHLLELPQFRTLTDRFANFAELCDAFEQATRKLPCAEIVRRMSGRGVPCAKANRLGEVFDDPRVTHRDSVIEVEHPQGGKLRQARPPAIFDGEPCGVRRHAPALGEHTESLLSEAGLDTAAIARLRDAGVVG